MMNDYQRIAKAIDFLSQHVEQQPTLEQVAAHVHLSAFHFQRLFCQWAGISPKRFLQVITLEKAKSQVSAQRSLLDISGSVGLSSSSRLYDHFVSLEAVTPGEFKKGGLDLQINYGLHMTPFGELLIAQTPRGICKAVFTETDGKDAEILRLQAQWPNAVIVQDHRHTEMTASAICRLLRGETPAEKMPLHVAGSNFQVAVWRALLAIAPGDSQTYSGIAQHIQTPNATRAVANAIAANPVALLIPCHRVIRKSGALGGYRWGEQRKQVIRFYETAARHAAPDCA